MRKMYLDNRSQDAKIRQRILDVLQVNLTSPEGASTLLPAGVLGTELLGEPLRVANLILTEKSNCFKFPRFGKFRRMACLT